MFDGRRCREREKIADKSVRQPARKQTQHGGGDGSAAHRSCCDHLCPIAISAEQRSGDLLRPRADGVSREARGAGDHRACGLEKVEQLESIFCDVVSRGLLEGPGTEMAVLKEGEGVG